MGGGGELRVEDGDAGWATAEGTIDAHQPALDADLATRIGPVCARQYLHERRFAGAVLAHQSVDVPGIDGQVDIAQRLDAEEGLGDPAHFEDPVGHVASSPARR